MGASSGQAAGSVPDALVISPFPQPRAGRGVLGTPIGAQIGTGAKVVDAVRDLCARGLADIGIAAFITASVDVGMPFLWVNSAFTRQTGLSAEDLDGMNPTSLDVGYDPDSADTALVRTALLAGREIQRTVRSRRHDGTLGWCQITLSPITQANGAVTHWVGLWVDVTEQWDRYTLQGASLAAERQEREALDIVSRTSDLLVDLNEPRALRKIAGLVSGAAVTWCGFYLNDDGLRYTEGLDPMAPPSGRGRHHGRFAPGVAQELSRIARVPNRRGGMGIPAPYRFLEAVETDHLQELLDGETVGPVSLSLKATYPPWSASGWLIQDLEERLAVLPEQPAFVSVHAVQGRNQVLGLLVAVLQGGQASRAVSAEVDAHGTVVPVDRSGTLLRVIARRVGMAVDNARLYAREHRLAETLQRAMLPEQADIVGLDVWTYYAPNSEHAQVGGDWYDVLEIGDDTIGVVIGDVVGHDVEAAAAMGQFRSIVRAYAYELISPARVLERVDHLLMGMRISRSSSLVYATLVRPAPQVETGEAAPAVKASPASGAGAPVVAAAPTTGAGDAGGSTGGSGWSLEYSRAGHLPPLLLRGGQVTQLREASGALVGFGDQPRASGVVELQAGDALLFYTDGLIERRDRALRVGLDALVEASSAITAIDAAGIGEELLSRLAEAPEDDVALVVVRIPDPVADPRSSTAGPRSRRWVLPSEPASISRARHAVIRTSQAWGLPDSANAELVVSELVANGVLHGWGHLSLRLFDTGDGLRIEVEDSNPAPPVATDGHPGRVGGFGMQIVGRLADWGWRPVGSGKLVWARVRPSPRSIRTQDPA